MPPGPRRVWEFDHGELETYRTQSQCEPVAVSADAGTARHQEDAADLATPRWFVGDTPGPLGMNDHADPDAGVYRLRAGDYKGAFAPTISDARRGLVKRFEVECLTSMSFEGFAALPSGADRREWIAAKLGHLTPQLYESAAQQQIPVQLLAVVIANELLDINVADIAQESLELSVNGSYGIAQIQVDTALKDNLIPHDEQFALAKAWGMEKPFVKGRLQTGQFAVEAAAREIRLLLNRMEANPESAWVKQFNFSPTSVAGQRVFDGLPSPLSQELREATLAEMVAAAYNSPDIINAVHPERYRNGPIHGKNARVLAQLFYRWHLFRP